MISSRKLLILIGFITSLVISACSGNKDITPTKALRGAIVPTRIATDIPTATYTATATATDIPTATYTATATTTPTATVTPSDTPTATPTLTPTEEPSPPADTVAEQPPPQPIAYGDSIDGVITVDIYQYLYEFTARAGDRVDIKMLSRDGTLDPLLRLIDDEGILIAENDDDLNNTGRDSFLQGVVIPDDGIYTIVATRFQQELGSTEGSFTLLLSLSPEGGDIVSPANNLLQYGEQISGEITDSTHALAYNFMARQGDVIDIQMEAIDESSSLDPLLLLINSNGEALAENDDDPEGTGRNSFIHTFEVPADGIYTIIATRFQQELGTTTGRFEVSLALNETLSDPTSERLQYGTSYSGQITQDVSSEWLLFDAEAGDIINISMQATSGSLDPLLILLDKNENELIRNDDDEQGVGSNSFIREFEIPADGTYIIVATRFQEEQGTTTGRFTLLIEKVIAEA